MENLNTHTLINHQTGELAFKLFTFDNVSHYDHVQRLNYFSLIWIQEGRGEAIVDFGAHRYGSDHLFALSPYQPFMFKAEEETKGIIIHFHPDFFCIHKHQKEVDCNGVLFNNIYDAPFVVLDDKSKVAIDALIDSMKQEIEENHFAVSDSILSYLKLLLIKGTKAKNDSCIVAEVEHKKETRIIQALKTEIENNFRSKHSPKEYAEALHISPKALARISKNHFNKTLTTLIAERIVIEAKRELYLSKKSIKEIGMELGYEDEFYFSRFFKKNTSISPSMFRKTVGFGKGESALSIQ